MSGPATDPGSNRALKVERAAAAPLSSATVTTARAAARRRGAVGDLRATGHEPACGGVNGVGNKLYRSGIKLPKVILYIGLASFQGKHNETGMSSAATGASPPSVTPAGRTSSCRVSAPAGRRRRDSEKLSLTSVNT